MTLVSQLSVLEASGLLRLAQVQPELEYLFRHVLIQDAAYHSLVKHDRIRLHRAIGEALERMYPERLTSPEFAPILARHFDEAGDDRRALKYHVLGGDGAFRVYANAEAVAQYTRALEIARRHEASAEQLIHLYRNRGRALELLASYAEAVRNYQEMEALGRERGDPALELAALIARGTIHAIISPVHDPAQAEALSQRALSLACQTGDRPAEAKSLWNLSLVYLYGHDDPHQAVIYGEQSLAIARELNLREQLAYVLNDLGRAYLGLGRLVQAQEAFREGGELFRELGNLPMLADNCTFSATSYMLAGDYQRALELTREGYRISQSTTDPWGQLSGGFGSAVIYFEFGDVEKAIEALGEAVRLCEQIGLASLLQFGHAFLGLIYATLGVLERGRALYLQATAGDIHPVQRREFFALLAQFEILSGDLVNAEMNVQKSSVAVRAGRLFFGITGPSAYLAKAWLALAQRDYERAVAELDTTMTFMRQLGVRALLPEAGYLLGQALRAQGRTDEARAVLESARAEAEALGSRRMLWAILAALSQVEAQRGHRAEAGALRHRAREVIEYMANQAGSPELRTSFLNLPDVRSVMNDA